MYRNNKYDKEIIINAENGVYVFDNNSSTGKTLLCKEIKKLTKLGEKVLSFTLDDIDSGIDIIGKIKKYKPEVLMFDRYDMYAGYFDKFMEKHKDDCIILVDCKSFPFLNCADTCNIEFSPDKIDVLA